MIAILVTRYKLNERKSTLKEAIFIKALKEEYFFPTAGIELEGGDLVLVSETTSSVARISCTCQELKWIIKQKGKFHYPTSISEHKGKLYISDRWNHRICVYDQDGNEEPEIKGNGKLLEPTSLCFDKTGRLFVLSSGSRSISVFSTNGLFLYEMLPYKSPEERREEYLFGIATRSFRPGFCFPRGIIYLKSEDAILVLEKDGFTLCSTGGINIAKAADTNRTVQLCQSKKTDNFFGVTAEGSVYAIKNQNDSFSFSRPYQEEGKETSVLCPWVLTGGEDSFIVNPINKTMRHLPVLADSKREAKKYYITGALCFKTPTIRQDTLCEKNTKNPYKMLLSSLGKTVRARTKVVKRSSIKSFKITLDMENELLGSERLRVAAKEFYQNAETENIEKNKTLGSFDEIKSSMLMLNNKIMCLESGSINTELGPALDFLEGLETLCMELTTKREKAYASQTRFLGFLETPRKRMYWVVFTRLVEQYQISINFLHALIVEHLAFLNRVIEQSDSGACLNAIAYRESSLDSLSFLSFLPFGYHEFKWEYFVQRGRLLRLLKVEKKHKITENSLRELKNLLTRLKENQEVYPLFVTEEKNFLATLFYPALFLSFPLDIVSSAEILKVFNKENTLQVQGFIALVEKYMEKEITKRESLFIRYFDLVIMFRKTSPKSYKNRFELTKKREEMECLLNQSLGMIENLFVFWGILHLLVVELYLTDDYSVEDAESFVSNLREETLTFNKLYLKMKEDITGLETGSLKLADDLDDLQAQWEREKAIVGAKEALKSYAPYSFLVMSIYSMTKAMFYKKAIKSLPKDKAVAEIYKTCPGQAMAKHPALKTSKYNLCLHKEIRGSGAGKNQLCQPTGLGMVGDFLWVLEEGNHRIQVFSLDDFKSQGFVGSYGSNPGEFIKPGGVAVSEDGSVFISDSSNHRIQVFSSKGEFLYTFGSFGDGDGEFIYPLAIALDPQDGNLWISDWQSHKVKVFTRDGKFIKSFGKHGEKPGEFNAPAGIVFDEEGCLLVGEMGNSRIQFFSTKNEPEPIKIIGGEGDSDALFDSVCELHIGPDRRLYAVDLYNGRIQVFDQSGKHLYNFGGLGTGAGEVKTPVGIAGNSEYLIVSDYHTPKVLVYRFS